MTRSDVGLVIDTATVTAHHQAGRHAHGLHALEVLDHLRQPYRRLDALDLTGADDLAVLVTAELGPVTPEQRDALEAWVRAGGVLVLGDHDLSLAGLAGVTTAPAEFGRVDFADDPLWTQRPSRPIRAITGHQLTPTGDDVSVLATWADAQDTAAITRRPLGDGVVFCLGVAVWETLVTLLQGHPVTEDGRPAADGSAPLDEGILKAEDGLAFDIDADRQLPPGEPDLPGGRYEFGYPPPYAAPLFDLPQADLWAIAVAQLVWAGLDHVGSANGWLHYWPAGVPAMAHMSHDSDGNIDEEGQAALDAFAEADVKVTWCQVYNVRKYSPEIYDKITAAGHEHALHYNAMDDADIAQWGWEQIKGQYEWAQELIRTDTKIISNKNHYTRWEGWTEFYQWCEQLGIQLDESRGPSKIGSVGFTFGTAHVGFPMGDVELANRPMDVINLPLHTQDLCWASHASSRDVILDGAESVHGVAHFLFHGPHLLRRPLTRAACSEVAQAGRARGMRWWTADQINTWERSRRRIDVAVTATDTGWTVEVTAAAELAEAGVVLTLPGVGDGEVTVSSGTGSITPVVRHGRTFHELAVDLTPGTHRWELAAR
ncbi:hypothetical protein [Microlunatus sp. Y2014]|uniref:hypothetical protein n=1 Tax=Microlunatus sp. Y2014 TaxID=3418488 RepID=UPI003DA6DA1B